MNLMAVIGIPVIAVFVVFAVYGGLVVPVQEMAAAARGRGGECPAKTVRGGA